MHCGPPNKYLGLVMAHAVAPPYFETKKTMGKNMSVP